MIDLPLRGLEQATAISDQRLSTLEGSPAGTRDEESRRGKSFPGKFLDGDKDTPDKPD